jgi:hypothetical protein
MDRLWPRAQVAVLAASSRTRVAKEMVGSVPAVLPPREASVHEPRAPATASGIQPPLRADAAVQTRVAEERLGCSGRDSHSPMVSGNTGALEKGMGASGFGDFRSMFS